MHDSSLSAELQETLAVFGDSATPLTTPEVADDLDVGRRTAYARLERLVESDRLETKKVGANARVWWRTGTAPPRGGGAEDWSSGGISSWGQQFHSLVETTEEYAIFMLDPEGHVKTWNPGAERIKGYDADDILDAHYSQFYTESARADGVPEKNLVAAAKLDSVRDEGWRLRANGSRFWAQVTITAIREDDDLVGFAKVTRDMTDRREYEQQLREEKAFVEGLLDTQPDVLYAFDADRQFLRWNDRLRAVTGYTDADLEAMDPLDFVADRATDETKAVIEQVLERGDRRTVELPLVTADGEEIPYEFTGGPLTDENGDVTGVTGIGRDVSERKARERQLERQREELQSELEDVFTRIGEAFLVLDDDWRITFLNDRAASSVERPVGALLQARIWDVFPEFASGDPREAFERAVATQEPVESEFRSERFDGWIDVRGYPSETGISVYVRDITDRKARERELEEARHRYETLVENFPNGAVTLVDEDLRYRTVGGTPIEATNATSEELESSHLRDALPASVADVLVPRYEDALDGEASSFETDVGDRSYQIHVLPVRDGEGDVFAAMGMSQDITERTAYERELELYETIVDTVEDGIYVLDDEFRFTEVNDAYAEMTGYDREALLGAHSSLVISDDVAAESLDRTREIEDDGGSAVLEADIRRADGSRLRAESRFTALPFDDAGFGKVGIVRDVSERVERERELQDRVRQQAVVAELGQRAIEDPDLDVLFEEVVALVADTLDNDFCNVLALREADEELLLRQGVGWNPGLVGEATVSAVEDDSQAAYTLATEEPVIVEDLETEARFSGPEFLTMHGVRSGISTIIGTPGDPWGILGTHDRDPKEFSEHDATFVQAVANVLAAAVDRHHHDRTLVRQREQLAALNSLNEVVRETTSAVIEQSTREEIERTVCERLAETESYLFAWTGEADPATQRVELRTEAGVEGYLDGMTISIDPDDEESWGATGRALRTGEVQVTHDIHTDSRYDPWRDYVEGYDYRSSAAIPIVHEDTIYGALNVYAKRPAAFTGEERTVIAQLGEIVGHAIAATERKRALMSDDLVELEFQIEDVFATLDVLSETDDRITLDNAVPTGDDAFVVYGTASGNAIEVVEELVETLPHWESLTVRSSDDPSRFELRLTDPPVLSVIASLGGYVEEAIIENGDYRMTIHLAPTVDVRRVIDAVEDAYPTAEMIRRRQISRTREEEHHPLQQRLVTKLTDKQRASLEAAYYAGLFEWPRDASAEEVADSLGVAPSTFHQHLRKAERKVFEWVFSSPV